MIDQWINYSPGEQKKRRSKQNECSGTYRISMYYMPGPEIPQEECLPEIEQKIDALVDDIKAILRKHGTGEPLEIKELMVSWSPE